MLIRAIKRLFSIFAISKQQTTDNGTKYSTSHLNALMIKKIRLTEFDQYWNSINKLFFAPYPLAYDAYFEGMRRGLALAGADDESIDRVVGTLKEHYDRKVYH